MRHKTFAMLLAAALLAGSLNYAVAEDNAPPPGPPEAVDEMEDYGFRGPGARFGHRGWRDSGPRHRGPGRHWRNDDDGPRGRSRFDSPGRGFHMGPRGHGMGMGMGVRFFEELDLSDSQKKQMIDLMTANFRAKLEAKVELMEAAAKVRDLRRDDSAGGDAIIAANTELGAAKGKLAAVHSKFRQDMKQVLTPEQLDKIEKRRPGSPSDGRRFDERRRPDRDGPRQRPDDRRPSRGPRQGR